MLKSGETKIPIQFRTCKYCIHENGNLTDPKTHESQYCKLNKKHKNMNHWVTAQPDKSCCGWEPKSRAEIELSMDRLAGRAVQVNESLCLSVYPRERGECSASRHRYQNFNWVEFMECRPCTVDT